MMASRSSETLRSICRNQRHRVSEYRNFDLLQLRSGLCWKTGKIYFTNIRKYINVFVGSPDGRRLLVKRICKWGSNINIYFTEISCDGWKVFPDSNRCHRRVVLNTKINLRVLKCGETVHYLSNWYQIIEIRLVGAKLFHENGRTDGHGANRCFSQFCERA